MSIEKLESIHDNMFEESIMDQIYDTTEHGKRETELHRFYLYDKTKEENSMVPFLYAYTRSDELSREFKQTRNSNLFIYKHSKESIDVVADIEFRHPGIRLRKTCLKSRSPKDPTKTIPVPIVLTCEEELKVTAVQDDLFNIINAKSCMEDMTILSTELNYALKELGYFDIFRFLSQMQYIDTELSYFYGGVSRFDGLEPENSLPNIIPDEFSLFMLMYGNTLKC